MTPKSKIIMKHHPNVVPIGPPTILTGPMIPDVKKLVNPMLTIATPVAPVPVFLRKSPIKKVEAKSMEPVIPDVKKLTNPIIPPTRVPTPHPVSPPKTKKVVVEKSKKTKPKIDDDDLSKGTLIITKKIDDVELLSKGTLVLTKKIDDNVDKTTTHVIVAETKDEVEEDRKSCLSPPPPLYPGLTPEDEELWERAGKKEKDKNGKTKKVKLTSKEWDRLFYIQLKINEEGKRIRSERMSGNVEKWKSNKDDKVVNLDEEVVESKDDEDYDDDSDMSMEDSDESDDSNSDSDSDSEDDEDDYSDEDESTSSESENDNKKKPKKK